MTRRSQRTEDHYGSVAPKPPTEPADLGPLWSGEPEAPAPTHVVEVRAHLRRVSGVTPPTGAEARDAALADREAEDDKRTAIEYVRTKLAELYRERVRTAALFPEERVVAGVTADDIDAVLHRWAQCPKRLHEIPGLWKGAVFRGGGWEMTGQRVRSSRAHMRSTELPVWKVKDASARRSA